MWQQLQSLGFTPAVITDATVADPNFTSMGDLLGSTDLLCHEIIRRLKRESFMTNLFKQIDYFERQPIFDWRDFPSFRIVPGNATIDYGVGDLAVNQIVIESVISENAQICTPVPYGRPTIHMVFAWLQSFFNGAGIFNASINGGQPSGIANYSRPGSVRQFVEVKEGQGTTPTRAVWSASLPWLFTLHNIASTQKNENISIMGG